MGVWEILSYSDIHLLQLVTYIVIISYSFPFTATTPRLHPLTAPTPRSARLIFASVCVELKAEEPTVRQTGYNV